ncbi:MAG TPA: PDZ domain-containing protein [Vicinamibacteria bacterium]|nr:PDZ domain-containing protein [Vicinamibacteria bacterium]
MLAAVILAVLSAAPPDLAAVGIVLSPRPESSVAILRADGRTRVVGPGDTAFGGRVARITSHSVVLEFEDGRRELRLAASTPPARAARAVATPPAGEPADRAGADAAARVLERQEVERRLGTEIPRILAETTLLPVSDGSATVGFTLTRVPEGTLLTDAGLRPGDVLTHVNDVAIDSLPTLIALWPRLQSASTLRAQVLRNGQPISLTVTLR